MANAIWHHAPPPPPRIKSESPLRANLQASSTGEIHRRPRSHQLQPAWTCSPPWMERPPWPDPTEAGTAGAGAQAEAKALLTTANT